jgi:hypothetical protein
MKSLITLIPGFNRYSWVDPTPTGTQPLYKRDLPKEAIVDAPGRKDSQPFMPKQQLPSKRKSPESTLNLFA